LEVDEDEKDEDQTNECVKKIMNEISGFYTDQKPDKM
jgi:hypothetical protein